MNSIVTLALLITSLQARAQERFSREQLEARFYYDLGSSRIDISSYPQKQKENYQVFAKTCSQCHTLARPINSPLKSRNDWSRYVRRMHIKAKTVPGISISGADAKTIIDFLSYDSDIRKIKNKTAFEKKTSELKSLFAQVRKNLPRIQAEEDKKKIKEPAPYTGVK